MDIRFIVLETFADNLIGAGYAFSKSDSFDQIVRQFLWDRNYNIEEIEAALLDATSKQLS